MNYLIIGASSGIGLELAKILHGQGHQVMTASRTQSQALQALGVPWLPFDATQHQTNFGAQLPDTLQGVAYCPGSINLKPFHRYTEAELQADFETNALGAAKVLQAAFPALKRAGGASVVLFSTVAVKLGMTFHASIAMAKGAVEGLGKSLAAEWAAHQIRVNVIAPSLTDTPLAAKLLSSDEKRDASAKRHPLGRVGQAEEIAASAAFLLSPQAAWITGQVIGIDGGMGSLKP